MRLRCRSRGCLPTRTGRGRRQERERALARRWGAFARAVGVLGRRAEGRAVGVDVGAGGRGGERRGASTARTLAGRPGRPLDSFHSPSEAMERQRPQDTLEQQLQPSGAAHVSVNVSAHSPLCAEQHPLLRSSLGSTNSPNSPTNCSTISSLSSGRRIDLGWSARSAGPFALSLLPTSTIRHKSTATND